MNALTLDRFEDFMPEFFRRFSRPLAVAEAGDIRVDITENDKDYQVRAEIPGANKEDMRVHIDGNFVSLSAEVKEDREEKSRGRLLIRESFYGRVSRGFSLAHEINDKGVVAKL
jgi:HSP20 family protein